MTKLVEWGVCGFAEVDKIAPKMVQVVSLVRMTSPLSQHNQRETAVQAVVNALEGRFGYVKLSSVNLEVLEPEVEIKTLYPCREIGKRSFKRLALRMKMNQLISSLSEEYLEEDHDRCYEDLLTACCHLEACRPCSASMKLGLLNDRGILSFNETITL